MLVSPKKMRAIEIRPTMMGRNKLHGFVIIMFPIQLEF